jgi:hypothetical protein
VKPIYKVKAFLLISILVFYLSVGKSRSNRTYRKNLVARSDGQFLDELYQYDGLNQLKKFHRGLLASSGLQQGWDFDATGNWKNFTQFDPADAGRTLDDGAGRRG